MTWLSELRHHGGSPWRWVQLMSAPPQSPPEPWHRWGWIGPIAVEQRRDALLADCPAIPESEWPALVDCFLQDQGLSSAAAAQAWVSAQHITSDDLTARAIRHAQWLQLCERQFTPQLPSYFLKRKPQLDQVSYWALSIEDEALSLELHQRLKEGECSFAELLTLYPAAPDAGLRGRFGPVPLAELPEGLAELLRVSRPGQLWPPKPIQQGWLIVQLDQSQPAVLDQSLRRRLLLEMGEPLLKPDSAVAPS